MSRVGKRVWKARSYAPTLGGCIQGPSQSMWVFLDEPIKAVVRAVEECEDAWTSPTHPQWAQAAQDLGRKLGMGAAADISFTAPKLTQNSPYLERSAAVAAVRAVAEATEFPLNSDRLTAAEDAPVTGVAYGAAVVHPEVEVFPERFLCVYGSSGPVLPIRVPQDPKWSMEWLQAQQGPSHIASTVKQAAGEVSFAVVGNDSVFMAFTPWQMTHITQVAKVSRALVEALGPSWRVSVTRTAGPTADLYVE